MASAVLASLGRADREALESLAMTEPEFRAVVWPRLPAARPERHLPPAYVWEDLRQKSNASLAAILAARPDRAYRLLQVRFAGETTDYGTFRVHRRTVLTVKHAQTGLTADLQLCGSMLEHNGQWKVFSYVIDR